jgi:hypothetical protein
VSGHKPGDRPTDAPDPGLKTKVLRHEVRMSVAELERRARKELQRMRGSCVDDSDFMEACFKAVLDQCEAVRSSKHARRAEPTVSESRGPSTAESTEECSSGGEANLGEVTIGERVLTAAEIERLVAPRYQIAVTVCEGCKQGWEHGACGTTLLTPPELERALCDCVDIGNIDDEPGRAKRSIAPSLKRHVLHRDNHQCRVPGCTAITNIDVHHILFLMYGGKNTLANLITLCEGHHLALHAGALELEGDAYTAKFTFKPQNKFKIETRAVECAAALKKRGIAKELIKPAIAATRTHVGMQDLTTQQWVEIALAKLPVGGNGPQ